MHCKHTGIYAQTHTHTDKTHTHTFSPHLPRQIVLHPIQQGTNSPCIQTHEILNKSIMCRQMNNKQQNCLILSITHNTMKLKSWRLCTHKNTHTHAHTHKHLTQLTHFEPSTKWYTYIISHPQMCFYAAHILSMNMSIICQCDCCCSHNNTVLSAITQRRT